MILYILIGSFGLGLILFTVFIIIRIKRQRRLLACKRYDLIRRKKDISSFFHEKALIFFVISLFV